MNDPSLIAISIGRPQIVLRGGRQYSTAINKRPVDGPIEVGPEGVAGDRVSDTSVHGGPDKAVCVYPHDHYPFWMQRLAEAKGVAAYDMPIAAFGENFTTAGLLERDVCVGDRFAVASALFEVSQPRQPCFKLAGKHDEPRMVRWIHENGFSGFYLRVLTPGVVQAGDAIRLQERPRPELTIQRLIRARASDDPGRGLLEELAALPPLSASWRKWAAAKLGDERDDSDE